jgi:uroporphyrinogen-III synthase
MNPRWFRRPPKRSNNFVPFEGLRVLSLESRRSTEIERLIRSQGGDPFVAPSMREVPLTDNPQAFEFAERLFRGEFEMMILLTGVGTRLLNDVLSARYPENSFKNALRLITLVVRGSKPMAVLREWGIAAQVMVPEPNTWREILAAIDGRTEQKIVVQEYGRPAAELIEALRGRGAKVSTVPVYQWDLPLDCAPLREALRRLAASEFDVAMFTTSIQVQHLVRIAAEEGLEENVRRAMKKIVIASVGPSTSETLREFGFEPDMEPSHPKMGFLVNETAARASKILQSKQ